jgi:hypothetical protein
MRKRAIRVKSPGLFSFPAPSGRVKVARIPGGFTEWLDLGFLMSAWVFIHPAKKEGLKIDFRGSPESSLSYSSWAWCRS